jgi:hypothetical protein
MEVDHEIKGHSTNVYCSIAILDHSGDSCIMLCSCLMDQQ